jgi:hypothetical protein
MKDPETGPRLRPGRSSAADLPSFDDDPDRPPTEEELAESARLREALDDPSKAHEGAELARSLSAAYAPQEIATAESDRIVAKAIETVRASRRGIVIRVSFGASAIVALAASVMLTIRSADKNVAPRTPAVAAAQLAVTRSTQSLFPEPFAQTGGQSARVDRIAMARAGDLRDNEFAKWGVR